jgi:tetratricopeptide (TPR) repeat protein
MNPLLKILIDIKENQSFEELEPFKSATLWSSLAQEERLLLAHLFVMQGAHQLTQGSHQVLESFEIASRVAADDSAILLEQAAILGHYRENGRCLHLAYGLLDRVLRQNPYLFKAWCMQAQVLTWMGLFEDEATYFSEANQSFENAQTLSNDKEEISAEFYWQWGFCLAALGVISGEPSDFHCANIKYDQAYALGCRHIDFLKDYGHNFIHLAHLLGQHDYFTKALQMFNQAICADPQSFDAWYHQACCIQSLGEFHREDKLLDQADSSFGVAVELNPTSATLWLKWGLLQISQGKLKYNTLKLEAGLEKLAKAHQLEPDHPEILVSWAETELFLGSQEERLDLLHSAEAKILSCLERQLENSDIWYLYGSCSYELGLYFDEDSYYLQAIEKFQYGLSLTKQNPLLWYGLALCHFALAELKEDKDAIEKSLIFYSRVVECGGDFGHLWNDWGVALLKLGEMTQQVSLVELAIEKFERALKQPIREGEVVDIDLQWVYNYGCALDLLGDLTEESAYFEKAVDIFNQILELNSEFNQARFHLALALFHLGQSLSEVDYYQQAIQQFSHLLNQEAESDFIHLELGIVFIYFALLMKDNHHPEPSQELYRQAENHLIQAAALGNTLAYYQLAGLYSLTKCYDQAMHYLERAQFEGILPEVEELFHDEWLEGLRQMSLFQTFINELPSQPSHDNE